MNKFMLSALAALALSTSAVVAQAATDQEALKCGVAAKKVLSSLIGGIGRAQPKLCKDASDLAGIAGKIVDKTLKAANKFNDKFTVATCDPDMAMDVPLDTSTITQANVEAALKNSSLGGSDPVDELCDNL